MGVCCLCRLDLTTGTVRPPVGRGFGFALTCGLCVGGLCVRLCDPCALVRRCALVSRVRCVSCVSRLPPVRPRLVDPFKKHLGPGKHRGETGDR